MREPGYYWVHIGGEPFIARWDSSWFAMTGDEIIAVRMGVVAVIGERIPAPGEPCTCEAARRATHEMAEKLNGGQ